MQAPATARSMPPLPLPPGVDEPSVFRSLFAAYPDALLLVDDAGLVVLANPTAAALLGYTVQELVGIPVDALTPDAIRPRHAAYREAYGRAPRARPMGTHGDLVARRKDGSEVMVEIALSPLHDLAVPLVVAAIRGIGAYPRVKQALQRERYSEHLAQLGRLAVDARERQLVLDHVPVIAAKALGVAVVRVYLVDAGGAQLHAASGVGSVAGEADGSLAAADSLPDTVLALGHAVTLTARRGEQRCSIAQPYLDAGLVSALAVPLVDRERTIGVIAAWSPDAQRFGDDEMRFLESVANLVATSLQRAQSEEALSHAQRLESVGQLTGGIAHDFNNLLTVIQGNLQVLGELPALALDARGQQLLGAAARATRRGAELTDKLLAFARRQVLQPSAVDVGALLQALSDMLRRTLDQRIAIAVDVHPACPPALADPGQLEAALLNIAINARDAMPGGGVLHFRAVACDGLPQELRQESDEPGDVDARFVAISIADNGVGMSDAVRARAFEPFFTTKELGRGTGLGLSTVYGFAKQSRGAVSIDSAPGVGTTLTLYIPRSQHAEIPGEADDGVTQPLPAELRVLLVEDDAEVAAVLRNFLGTLQCHVTLASSGESALLALGPRAAFDVLLTDIALGAGMRGTELATLAQQRCPALAVLLMSGFSKELLAADRESPPSWELLRKPCTREELARALARVIAAR